MIITFYKEETFNNMKKRIKDREISFKMTLDLDFQIQIQLCQINS